MTVLSNIITPSNVLTTTNTATVTNKTLTSPTVTGMTVSDGTANGVTYLNGSKVLTSGSALTFDGSRLFLGTTAVTTSSSQSGEVYSSGAAGFMFTNTTAANYALSVKNEGTSGTRNLINFYEGTGGGSARANISLDGSANFAITSSTSLVFSPSSAEGMRLTSTGLGIGTSSPSRKLDVVVSSNTTYSAADNANNLNLFNSSTTDGTFASIRLGAQGSGSGGIVNLYGVQTSSTGSADFVVVNRNAGTFQENLRLDSAGNLGLGVTPSAWDSTYKAIQVGARSMFYGIGSEANMANNAYYNSGYKYVATSAAGLYTIDANVHKWYTAASGTAGNAITFTQAMTLDASGNLAVGTTSPINNSGYGGFSLNGTSGSLLSMMTNGTESSRIASLGDLTSIQCKASTGYITFVQGVSGGTERARIDSSGNFLFAKTASDVTVAGTQIESTGTVGIVRNGAVCLIVNRLTDDGTLVSLRQASTEEGTISVSGTTVSYNGGHLSRWAQMLTTPELLKGTVMSNLDEMNVYTKDGQPVDNEQLNKVKVSDTEGDMNVAGVFVNWSHDEDHNVDEINMAMTGDMIIRIAQGVTVVRGDLLMSAGDGTAKPQGDDIIRSKTVAKVTSNHVTCTYADGSYCVPCVLMAC